MSNNKPFGFGDNKDFFFTSEIGINANGHLDLAFRLIDMACNAGCDCVKFQMRFLPLVYSKKEMETPRVTPFGETNGDLKNQLEFSLKEYEKIDSYCKEKGILWTASPWDTVSVDKLMLFDPPYIKIASASVTDKNLLKAVCDTRKPIFLSTGLCDLEIVEKVVDAVDRFGGDLQCIYACTSTYPSNDDEINLRNIISLRNHFGDEIVWGYSGHEAGHDTLPTLMAYVLGAKAFERHITVDNDLFGSDQSVSMESEDLCNLLLEMGRMETLLGNYKKVIQEREKPIIEKLRKVNNLEEV